LNVTTQLPEALKVRRRQMGREERRKTQQAIAEPAQLKTTHFGKELAEE
jgi:hypothetical protein